MSIHNLRPTAIALTGAMTICLIASVGQLRAATIGWKGETWSDSYGNTSLNVTGADELIVTATPAANAWAAAQFNTSVAYRTAAAPWVEVGFIDSANTSRKEIWIEDETTSPLGSAGGWLQFGANGATYRITYNDYDADLTDDAIVNFSSLQTVDTGVARTAGEHLLKIGRRIDGTVDFWVDGALAHSLSAGQFNPNYFGDIYLGSRYEDATFTQFASGDNYAIPEPATLALAGAAGLGLIAAHRRRRNG